MLERGLQAELTEHLGYEQGRPGRPGLAELPQRLARRRRCTPRSAPVDAGRAAGPGGHVRAAAGAQGRAPPGGGLDEMIISLYAGGMTVRDIGHHLQRTLRHRAVARHHLQRSPTRSSRRSRPGRHRPLDEVYPIVYVDALVVKVRDGGARAQQGRPPGGRRRHRRGQARAGDLGAVRRGRQVLARVLHRAAQPRRPRRADRLLRRAGRACPRRSRRSGRTRHRADLRGAPDPGLHCGTSPTPTARRIAALLRADLHRRQRRRRRDALARVRRLRHWARSTRPRSRSGNAPGTGSPRSWRSRPRSARSSTPPTRSSR